MITIVRKSQEASTVVPTPKSSDLLSLVHSEAPVSQIINDLKDRAIADGVEFTAYSILDALKEHSSGRKDTLMLVRHIDGMAYRVMGHDMDTHITKLMGPHDLTLRVKLTGREAVKYKPVWR